MKAVYNKVKSSYYALYKWHNDYFPLDQSQVIMGMKIMFAPTKVSNGIRGMKVHRKGKPVKINVCSLKLKCLILLLVMYKHTQQKVQQGRRMKGKWNTHKSRTLPIKDSYSEYSKKKKEKTLLINSLLFHHLLTLPLLSPNTFSRKNLYKT